MTLIKQLENQSLPEPILNMSYYIELSDRVVKALATIASYTNEQLHHLSNTQALQQLLVFRDLAIHLTTSPYHPTEINLSTLPNISQNQSQLPDHLCLYCGNYGHHVYVCYHKSTIYTYIPTTSAFAQTLNQEDYSPSFSSFPDT